MPSTLAQGLPPPLGLDPLAFPRGKIRNTDISRSILSLGLRAYRSYGPGDTHPPVVLFYDVGSSHRSNPARAVAAPSLLVGRHPRSPLSLLCLYLPDLPV